MSVLDKNTYVVFFKNDEGTEKKTVIAAEKKDIWEEAIALGFVTQIVDVDRLLSVCDRRYGWNALDMDQEELETYWLSYYD